MLRRYGMEEQSQDLWEKSAEPCRPLSRARWAVRVYRPCRCDQSRHSSCGKRHGRQDQSDYAGNIRWWWVLTGVVMFTADLLRAITIPAAVDFMAISQYGSCSSSGTVRIVKDLDLSITDRHVLFVEDVIDTG